MVGAGAGAGVVPCVLAAPCLTACCWWGRAWTASPGAVLHGGSYGKQRAGFRRLHDPSRGCRAVVPLASTLLQLSHMCLNRIKLTTLRLLARSPSLLLKPLSLCLSLPSGLFSHLYLTNSNPTLCRVPRLRLKEIAAPEQFRRGARGLKLFAGGGTHPDDIDGGGNGLMAAAACLANKPGAVEEVCGLLIRCAERTRTCASCIRESLRQAALSVEEVEGVHGLWVWV